MAYQDPGAAAYEERHRSRVLANLQRRAKTFGFELAPLTTAEAVSLEEEQWLQPINAEVCDKTSGNRVPRPRRLISLVDMASSIDVDH
jgi:hypothetical protein